MESHEERLHIMIQQSKIDSAKEQARDAARVIRDRQRDTKRSGMSMQGIGSSGSLSYDDNTVTPSGMRP